MISTKLKGDLAVGMAIAYYISIGYEVLLPIGDKRDYDIVIEKNGNFESVQVKYAGLYPSKNNKCCVGLRITGGNQSFKTTKKYSNDAFDYLFVYTAKGESYSAPWKNITARNEIWIEHPKYHRYNVTAAQR